jgi:cyclohexanecarboxylate-CoA ligase
MTAFSDRLRHWAATKGEATAVVDGTRRLTWTELDGEVDDVAATIEPGNVVRSQLRNGTEAVVRCLAADRAGAVHSPLLPAYRGRELRAIADGIERWCATPDTTVLLWTSGSTADPKGVLHTDRTLVAECEAMAAFYGFTAADVFLMASPVAHISGLLYGILLPVQVGARVVLMESWDAGAFLELVEREGATFSAGATPFLQDVVDHPRVPRTDTSSLRLFPCGGAAVYPELIRAAGRTLGVRTGRGYGSTEFPSITSSAGVDDPEEKRAQTDGRPIGANEVELRDGEVWARGPERCAGYLDERMNGESFDDDGWFRTGDLGEIDGDGYLTITGRTKDIIIRKGEKISAREIEDLLASHPKIADVAVVAVPDPDVGERACAVVVPRGEAPTLDEITAFLRAEEVSTRKLPERLELVAELPVSESGKVQKHVLVERLR